MMKTVSAQVSLSDLTRDQFRQHYEEVHVPLAICHLPFTGYVRNHIVGPYVEWFMTITEFYARDLEDLGKALENGVGSLLSADEERFMQRDRIAGGIAEEHCLSDGAPANAAGERNMVLVRWNGVDPEEASAVLDDWAQRIASQQSGVSYDLVTSSFYTSEAFPADALLWLPDFDSAPPPPERIAAIPLRVLRCETPRGQLLG